MRRIAALIVAALAAALAAPASAQAEPVLVPEISEHRIVLRQGFTGTTLLLYGALLGQGGARPGAGYDIVIVLKGPTEPVEIREKTQVAGLWVNTASTAFRSVPSYYALASSRPLADIVDARTAAIYELGLNSLQLSPVGAIDPEEQLRFSAGLVEQRMRQGLYAQFDGAVQLTGGVLYSARLPIPSNVRAGRYTAETFAILNGRVVTSAIAEVEVRKEGFERAVEQRSADNAISYGLVAIGLSLFMGWAAGRLFAYV